MSNLGKNTILYGPPGTGKTYNTVLHAVAIIEKKSYDDVRSKGYDDVFRRYNLYKKWGLIEFTTFHQSYGYEDFIEGIKPVIIEDKENISGGDLKYTVAPGIFKRFCAEPDYAINFLLKFRTIWAVYSYKEFFPFKENRIVTNKSSSGKNLEKVKKGEIIVYTTGPNENDEVEILGIGLCSSEAQESDEGYECYVNWIFNYETDDEVDIDKKVKVRKNGDYHSYVIQIQDWGGKMQRDKSENWEEKIRAILMSSKNIWAKLSKLSSELIRNRVFIIDEINRGNISNIFGELITLIEDTKRIGAKEECQVKLPYSGKLFGVPDNVYILGTMNTADRSLTALDTALRRRFDFIEMQPDLSTLEGVTVDGVDIKEMLETINKRITVLLDREHTIGHAYFMPLRENADIEKLGSIFKNKVIPLLQEYFYDDWFKIQLVLGDNQKKDEETKFITKEFDEDLFGKNNGNRENVEKYNRPRYKINENALTNIKAYESIYPGENKQ